MAWINYFRQGSCATIANVQSRFYTAGHIVALNQGNMTTISHQLYASPFFSPRAGFVDLIGIYVVTGVSNAFGQIGIYAIDSLSQFYPQGVTLTGCVAMTTTGLKTLTIAASFNPGTLYWFTLCANAAVSVRGIDDDFQYPVLGYNQDSYWPYSNLVCSINASSVPQTFPVSATAVPSTCPAIGVRYVSVIP